MRDAADLDVLLASKRHLAWLVEEHDVKPVYDGKGVDCQTICGRK